LNWKKQTRLQNNRRTEGAIYTHSTAVRAEGICHYITRQVAGMPIRYSVVLYLYNNRPAYGTGEPSSRFQEFNLILNHYLAIIRAEWGQFYPRPTFSCSFDSRRGYFVHLH